MKDDLISVIVPVYNVEKYLHKCINSIINQTYKNLEIILIDDGSTDNSGKICDEYALKDNRIKVIHKENGGLSSARNAGLDICSGDYIGFVDSDDYIAEDMYEYLYVNFKKNNADVAMCNFYNVFENRIEKSFSINDFDLSEQETMLSINLKYAYNAFIAVWNKLYKKTIIKSIRFPLNKCSEDSAILIDWILKTKKMSYTSNASYYYVRRVNSLSNRKIDEHLFDEVENFNKILKICHKKFGNCIDIAQADLFIAYRISLDRLLKSSNINMYIEEKIICQNYFRKYIRKFIFNNNINNKTKLIYLLISIHFRVYNWIKEKNEIIKKYYFNG